MDSKFQWICFHVTVSTYHFSSEGFDGIGDGHFATEKSGRMEQYGTPTAMAPRSAERVHTDSVVSLSRVQPGFCVSGSSDQVLHLYINS